MPGLKAPGESALQQCCRVYPRSESKLEFTDAVSDSEVALTRSSTAQQLAIRETSRRKPHRNECARKFAGITAFNDPHGSDFGLAERF
jgi:hypothetical protein